MPLWKLQHCHNFKQGCTIVVRDCRVSYDAIVLTYLYLCVIHGIRCIDSLYGCSYMIFWNKNNRSKTKHFSNIRWFFLGRSKKKLRGENWKNKTEQNAMRRWWIKTKYLACGNAFVKLILTGYEKSVFVVD